ncbi:Protein FAR1-RELATED SEQUENCE 5 [Hordeum vulgare]|nr:Protein FAR1-RELATED SEQUENCE 5 [Hordeum vulgare]
MRQAPTVRFNPDNVPPEQPRADTPRSILHAALKLTGQTEPHLNPRENVCCLAAISVNASSCNATMDAHDGTEAQHSYAAHAGLNSTATMYDCDDEEEEISSQPLLPFVGMQFDTVEDARIFCNEYAFKTGFGIHIGASRNSQKKGPTTLIKRVFECVRTGKPGSKADSSTASEGLSNGAASSSKDSWFEMDVTNKRQKNRLLRHDCKAKMIVGLRGNKWIVSHFVAEHTHPLMP